MTKQEALEILDTIPTIGDQVEALEIAIEALEASMKESIKESAQAWKTALNSVYGLTANNCQNPFNTDKLVLHNDKLIIEPIVYLKKQAYCQLLEEVKKQLESNSSVIILPPGLMAKIVRQESVFINGKWEKGETDE